MSTVSVGTIQSNTSDPVTFKNSSGTEIGTLCRAFCNFNGTTVVSPAAMTGVNGSFNVSSVLDNGTGDYTINFTTAMPDANYSANVSAYYITASTSQYGLSALHTLAAGSVRVVVGPESLTTAARVAADSTIVCVSVFR